MILIVFIFLYPLIFGTTLLVLNDKALIPGTYNYKCRQLERKTQLDTEVQRAATIQARYRAHENAQLDAIKNQPLQLEASK